ncbi:MAG: methyltransferase domain-containing protein [Chloroflexi bacterium]|nr:methyltransferase domain-containing protein [Chloroflexota bacterium]
MTTSRSNAIRSEQLDFLREAVAACAAFDAADRLGVLARLQREPAHVPTLARDCAISERGSQALLAVLTSLGLVEVDSGGTYRAATPDLVGLAALRRRWDHLAQAVQAGSPTVAGDDPAGASMLYPDTVSHLAVFFAAAAEQAADHLAGQGTRMLDVRAGAAPWSLAVAARDAGCRVTAIDLPTVLARTRQTVEAAGRQAQYQYVAGDIFATDWGSAAYDLVIAGNICHVFDDEANRRLLRRCLDALRPGGKLAILDALPNERLDGPRPVVLYALGLLLRTRHGRVYPFSTYAGWLREVGFEAVERTDLSTSTASLITAHRPGGLSCD